MTNNNAAKPETDFMFEEGKPPDAGVKTGRQKSRQERPTPQGRFGLAGGVRVERTP